MYYFFKNIYNKIEKHISELYKIPFELYNQDGKIKYY